MWKWSNTGADVRTAFAVASRRWLGDEFNLREQQTLLARCLMRNMRIGSVCLAINDMSGAFCSICGSKHSRWHIIEDCRDLEAESSGLKEAAPMEFRCHELTLIVVMTTLLYPVCEDWIPNKQTPPHHEILCLAVSHHTMSRIFGNGRWDEQNARTCKVIETRWRDPVRGNQTYKVFNRCQRIKRKCTWHFTNFRNPKALWC